MIDALGDLYQQVILDHSRSPRNFRVLPDATSMARGQNPLCGDQVQVFVRMDGDRIADVGFQGSGCAISKASASMMTTVLKGKSRGEAKRLFNLFHATVTTGEPQENEKLSVFSGVHRFPARVKCAILPWHAIVAALDGKSEPVTTESENI
jgi:nitrogen fixation NifU-like protein